MFMQAARPTRISGLESVIMDVISVPQNLFSKVTRVIGRFWFSLTQVGYLQGENRRLREEVARLNTRLSELQEQKIINERLRELLKFSSDISGERITAEVIGKDPSNWFRNIIVNKGSADGVAQNMPVVSHQGLVGRVVKVSAHTAHIMSIIDHTSSVGAIVQRSRDEGVIIGKSYGFLCEMKYLSSRAQVKKDDIIISSGIGGIFPKGLIIGDVMKVTKDNMGLMQKVEVKPRVDFAKLEEVLIIKASDHTAEVEHPDEG